jgi:hypothetical protein
MASRPHTTYKKRQKELARMEKQRDKVAKRQQRKLEKPDGVSFLIEGVDGETIDPDNPFPPASSPTEDTESPAPNPDDPPREV